MQKAKVFRSMVKISGLDMFYMDTQTEGPGVVCLHGRCGRAETWYDFMQHYSDRYRVIAPDQRGHGLSGAPEVGYTDREMADDVIHLLMHLNLRSAIVIGHSMGGAVAGYLAALYPQYVKAVAILDKSAAGPPKPQGPEVWGRNDPTRRWPLPFASRKEAIDYLKEMACSELEYQYFMNSLVETVEGYQMMFRSSAIASGIGQYVAWYDLLPKIKCPVLLIRSKSHEAVSDAELAKMQSLLADCTACEMSQPDHNVHLSDEEEFYRYIDAFLARVPSSGKS